MRKLIETFDYDLIKCDNEKCDYTIGNPTGDINIPLLDYVNVPCPKCEENLLTVTDYRDWERMRKTINWMNKWFSWLTIFYSKKAKRTTVSVNVHNGIHVKEKK